jgi:hypothetical protein
MSGRSKPEQGSGECELLLIRRIWGNVATSVPMRWSGGRVGLRRRIKAPFSQGARVQIPSGLFWAAGGRFPLMVRDGDVESGRGAGVEDGDVCAQASHGQLRRRRRESNTLPFRSCRSPPTARPSNFSVTWTAPRECIARHASTRSPPRFTFRDTLPVVTHRGLFSLVRIIKGSCVGFNVHS